RGGVEAPLDGPRADAPRQADYGGGLERDDPVLAHQRGDEPGQVGKVADQQEGLGRGLEPASGLLGGIFRPEGVDRADPVRQLEGRAERVCRLPGPEEARVLDLGDDHTPLDEATGGGLDTPPAARGQGPLGVYRTWGRLAVPDEVSAERRGHARTRRRRGARPRAFTS